MSWAKALPAFGKLGSHNLAPGTGRESVGDCFAGRRARVGVGRAKKEVSRLSLFAISPLPSARADTDKPRAPGAHSQG